MPPRASGPATSVFVALRRLVRFLRLADREAEAAHGLSAAQLFVLYALADRPAVSIAELADRTFTDQSSVSGVIAKLLARRLIIRKTARSDRRRAELRLSAAGEHVVRTAPRLPQTAIVEAMKGMARRQRTELVRSLDRLVAAIGATEMPPRLLFEDEPSRRKYHATR